jgi:hypothetical protein
MLLKRRWEHGLSSFICREALNGGNAFSPELASIEVLRRGHSVVIRCNLIDKVY